MIERARETSSSCNTMLVLCGLLKSVQRDEDRRTCVYVSILVDDTKRRGYVRRDCRDAVNGMNVRCVLKVARVSKERYAGMRAQGAMRRRMSCARR